MYATEIQEEFVHFMIDLQKFYNKMILIKEIKIWLNDFSIYLE